MRSAPIAQRSRIVVTLLHEMAAAAASARQLCVSGAWLRAAFEAVATG